MCAACSELPSYRRSLHYTVAEAAKDDAHRGGQAQRVLSYLLIEAACSTQLPRQPRMVHTQRRTGATWTELPSNRSSMHYTVAEAAKDGAHTVGGQAQRVLSYRLIEAACSTQLPRQPRMEHTQ